MRRMLLGVRNDRMMIQRQYGQGDCRDQVSYVVEWHGSGTVVTHVAVRAIILEFAISA